MDEERAEILDALVGIKLNAIGVTCLTAAGDGDGDAVLDESWADNIALKSFPLWYASRCRQTCSSIGDCASSDSNALLWVGRAFDGDMLGSWRPWCVVVTSHAFSNLCTGRVGELGKVGCSSPRLSIRLFRALLFIAEDSLLFRLKSWERCDWDAEASREKRKHSLSTSVDGVNSSTVGRKYEVNHLGLDA